MEKGEVQYPDRGTQQIRVIAPDLSSRYRHKALDLWFEHVVNARLRGSAIEVCYADDSVLFFEHKEDAGRILAVL